MFRHQAVDIVVISGSRTHREGAPVRERDVGGAFDIDKLFRGGTYTGAHGTVTDASGVIVVPEVLIVVIQVSWFIGTGAACGRSSETTQRRRSQSIAELGLNCVGHDHGNFWR